MEFSSRSKLPAQKVVSHRVESNQLALHPDLDSLLQSHCVHQFRKPIADHTRFALSPILEDIKLQSRSLILDLGCGTGRSTAYLAKRFPQSVVLGIDKSVHRLNKADTEKLAPNATLVRADSIDTLLLCQEKEITCDFCAIYYPNPWPKKKHIQRRFHGHPIFPILCAIAQSLELRTNWKIYAEEFLHCLRLMNREAQLYSLSSVERPISLFEAKYIASNHELYSVTVS